MLYFTDDNILQGWFKMKTTSIFPVDRLASLILMSKYVHCRSMSSKLFYIYKINQFVSKRSTYYLIFVENIVRKYQGKSVTSYLLMNINDLGAIRREFCT